MAITQFNDGARNGTALAEVINGRGYTLIVRVPDDETGGFEIGFESLDDAVQVAATAKDRAPALATEIDAAFA